MAGAVAVVAFAVGACIGDTPTVASTSAGTSASTSAPAPASTAPTLATATTLGQIGVGATTSTTPPGPASVATFRAAGRTLQVRASDQRKPYAQLGDQLPVPAGIQVEFGAPGADRVAGAVVPRARWDAGDGGVPLDVAPAGESGRWIWAAGVAPGEYGLEVIFGVGERQVVVRAPIRVLG